jgi:hypothetical protein
VLLLCVLVLVLVLLLVLPMGGHWRLASTPRWSTWPGLRLLPLQHHHHFAQLLCLLLLQHAFGGMPTCTSPHRPPRSLPLNILHHTHCTAHTDAQKKKGGMVVQEVE